MCELVRDWTQLANRVARVLLLFRHISDDVSPLSIDDLVVPKWPIRKARVGPCFPYGPVRAGEGGQIDRQGSGTGPPDAARLAPKLRGDVAAHHFLSPLEMTGRNHSRRTARQFDERAMPDLAKT